MPVAPQIDAEHWQTCCSHRRNRNFKNGDNSTVFEDARPRRDGASLRVRVLRVCIIVCILVRLVDCLFARLCLFACLCMCGFACATARQ